MGKVRQNNFQPIRKQRLSDDVTAQIRAHIAAGRLQPGDKLPAEREMAARFAVSRGAVREAMRNLELAGIINLRQGVKGGAFIGHGNPDGLGDNFRDLYYLGGISLTQLTEARIWLETLVSRIACERATKADLSALTENVDMAERLYHAGKLEEKIDVNIKFHNLLATATHNPIMEMLMAGLMRVMRDVVAEVGPENNDVTLRARRRFLQLLADKDADAAAAAMAEHLEQLQQRYKQVLKHRANSPRE